MNLNFVERGMCIAPFNTMVQLPFAQCETILANRPTQPVALPKEIYIGEDFRELFDDSLIGVIRNFCFFGGRAGAKSYNAVLCAVLRMRRIPNYKVANIRQHLTSLDQSLLALYKGTIARLRLRHEFIILENRIVHRTTGSTAIFKGIGVNVDNIRSLEDVNLCIVEEATQLTKQGIDVLVPTIRATGSQFVWLWNPSEVGPQAVDNRFRVEPKPEATIVSHVNFDTSNPYWFFGGLRGEERAARRNTDEHNHVWKGEYPKSSSSLVFAAKDWSVGYCHVPMYVQPRYGFDAGFSPDPSVFLRCWVIEPEEGEDKGIIYISDCVAERELSTADMPDFIDQIPNPNEEPLWVDQSEPRLIEDLQQAGYAAEGAPKGPGSIKAGIKFLKGYHIRVSPQCDPIVEAELKGYRHKVDKATGKKLPALMQNGMDHALDSLRYAVWQYIKVENGGVEFL